MNSLLSNILKIIFTPTVMINTPQKCYEMSIIYEGKVKSSRPSLRETRDKRPLGRGPDRSWCHSHTSVQLSWSKSMDWKAAHSYDAADVHGVMGCDQKALLFS